MEFCSKLALMLDFLITKLYSALEKSPESKEVRTSKLDAALLKNYSADIYEEALGRLDFPNYHNFENINDTFSDFIQKVIGVIDLVAPIKSKRIKQNYQEWFNGEVAEKISVGDKLFKKLKNQNFTLTKKCIK